MSAPRAGSGPIARALAKSLHAAQPDDLDAGTVALAKRLAVLLDEAAPRSAYAEHLRRLERVVVAEGDDEQQASFRKITDALGRHSVVSDLGPKYLAALTALGLTPAGRGVKGGGQNAGTPGGSKLDELRARRARGAG